MKLFPKFQSDAHELSLLVPDSKHTWGRYVPALTAGQLDFTPSSHASYGAQCLTTTSARDRLMMHTENRNHQHLPSLHRHMNCHFTWRVNEQSGLTGQQGDPAAGKEVTAEEREGGLPQPGTLLLCCPFFVFCHNTLCCLAITMTILLFPQIICGLSDYGKDLLFSEPRYQN